MSDTMSTTKENGVIWAEKNSTEPQMKSENSVALEAIDSTPITKNDFVKNECNDIGKINKHTRNCPQCNKEVTYALKSGWTRATKNNSLCNSCKVKGERNPQYGIPNPNRGKKFFPKEYYKQKNIDRQIRFNHKIEPYVYYSIKESQKSKCKVCGVTETEVDKLHLDHCHKTGKIRGFLCGRCNMALGLLQDNVEIITNLRKYLVESLGKTPPFTCPK